MPFWKRIWVMVLSSVWRAAKRAGVSSEPSELCGTTRVDFGDALAASAVVKRTASSTCKGNNIFVLCLANQQSFASCMPSSSVICSHGWLFHVPARCYPGLRQEPDLADTPDNYTILFYFS
jgi:hypothetical protein